MLFAFAVKCEKNIISDAKKQYFCQNCFNQIRIRFCQAEKHYAIQAIARAGENSSEMFNIIHRM